MKTQIKSNYFNNKKAEGLRIIEPKKTKNREKLSLPKNLRKELTAAGWTRETLGNVRSNHQIKAKKGFQLYMRRRKFEDAITGFSKKPQNVAVANGSTMQAGATGSNVPIGIQKLNMTPATATGSSEKLPELSLLMKYKSLAALRDNKKDCLLIGFDSEWQDAPVRTDMISWQFAVVDQADLVEFVFFRDGQTDLSLEDALGIILDKLKYTPYDRKMLRSYQYCFDWGKVRPKTKKTLDEKEAIAKSKYAFSRVDNKFTRDLIEDKPDKFAPWGSRDWSWYKSVVDYSNVDKINICLVCHFGRVDLSSLSYKGLNPLRYLSEVHGGLVSMRPRTITPSSYTDPNRNLVYPVLLSVADSMCHAPSGKMKLEDIGEVIGVEKIKLSKITKKDMRSLLNNDPVLFTEYASWDSVITMLYVSAIYGYNQLPPVTVISAGAQIMKKGMMGYLDCSDDIEFNRKYRGLEKVNHGKFLKEYSSNSGKKSGFIESTSLDPISADASIVQYFASQAYHGGYNVCTEVGYFPYQTFDYDLQNAYPTAMFLVPDIDWEAPIEREIKDAELTLDDFVDNGKINPILPFVGYLTFEFPDTVKYPCIPISVEGVPTYPLTSEGLDGVYVAGPFIWLALTLGARVFCKRGYFLRRLLHDDNTESRALSHVVKQLVIDRKAAKNGKGTGEGKDGLIELILKEIVCAGYGKVAQNVIDKSTWSAYKDEMQQLGCSVITNPVSAMMITSIVQVELIVAQNQIHDLGYMSCSVTTDGFISDVPFVKLKKLNLYGLLSYMKKARKILTDGKDSEIWEIKHVQNDLVNFTTRGNVSLHWYKMEKDGTIIGNPIIIDKKTYAGVCAHNSTKSGYDSDSYEDRQWLMHQVVSRTGPVEYKKEEYTSFRKLCADMPFEKKELTPRVHMDFDMKRKPIKASFTTNKVVLDDIEYDIAHFDTEPFRNVDEFRLYRGIKKNSTTVLRTEADWHDFEIKLQTGNSAAKPRDIDWAIINSCIMGYRAGFWDIKGLVGKSVEEKCEWINLHNDSTKKFKPSDWKNARKPSRQVNMLQQHLIRNKLNELINAD